MPRTLESVLRVMGPFLGVNESVAGDIQPPQYAEKIKNIVLNRGMIEVRPGLRNVLEIEDVATVPWINAVAVLPYTFRDGDTGHYISNGRVLIVASENGPNAILYITKPFVRTRDPYTIVGKMPALSREARGDIVHLADKSFTVFPDWDTPRVVQWRQDGNVAPVILPDGQGTALYPCGIAPPYPILTIRGVEAGEADMVFPTGKYAFAASLYDSVSKTESNSAWAAQGAPRYFSYVIGPDTIIELQINYGGRTRAEESRIDTVRLYMEIALVDDDPNADIVGGETAARLVMEIPFSASGVAPSTEYYVLDGRDVLIAPFVGAGVSLSAQGFGPYAPTRNGRPPKSNAAVVYDNKVCYASIDDDSYGVLFYSADGNGEHVAADSFITFDDEGREPITGLVVYQGRLIVFKETAIYVIAGVFSQLSNNDVALGNPAPQPLFSVHRSQAATGCYNTGGSSAIKECDGVLYYNAYDGIYGFDGLVSRKVSDPIRVTHSSVLESRRGRCSMANDRKTGLLWIAYALDRDRVFCFDYRKGVGDPSVGNWTIHQFPFGLAVIADTPPAECPVLSDEPLILVGTGAEPSKLLEMLAASRGRDETSGGGETYIGWEYETPWMSLGLLDRSKRVHNVTVFYGPGADKTFRLWVGVERERDRSVRGRSFASVHPANKPTGKFVINKRGTRIKLALSAGREDRCIGPFTGFAIDAEPIGRR